MSEKAFSLEFILKLVKVVLIVAAIALFPFAVKSAQQRISDFQAERAAEKEAEEWLNQWIGWQIVIESDDTEGRVPYIYYVEH